MVNLFKEDHPDGCFVVFNRCDVKVKDWYKDAAHEQLHDEYLEWRYDKLLSLENSLWKTLKWKFWHNKDLWRDDETWNSTLDSRIQVRNLY